MNFGLTAGERKAAYFVAVQAGLDKNYQPMEEPVSKFIEQSLAASS